MMKKYEANYSGFIYEKPKTYWSSESDIKKNLLKANLSDLSHLKAGGLPIISQGDEAYIDTGDSHVAITAVSGMKKSICAFMPLIYTLGKAEENMVITDPKGELFNRTASYLKEEGYNIKCLDFRDMDKDGLNVLEYPAKVYNLKDKDKGSMMISDLVNVFAERQRQSGCDCFWPDTAASYLNATASIMLDSYAPKNININNWAEFNTEQGVKIVKDLAHEIQTSNTAMINLKTILAEPERTLMSTLSTASSFLSPFIQNNKLARMLANSTFRVEDISKEKTALYIITDDTTTTCDTIVGIIISQLQTHLVDKAYKSKNGKLDTRVNFVLDEFTSFPIPNIENALATHRSRNIRYYLCIQSIDGLKRRYKHHEALLANCANILFMGSTEQELLQRISTQCGTTNITIDGSERPLISEPELMTLKKSWYSKECIYLNLSESLRFCAQLPSIEHYGLLDKAPPVISFNHPPVQSYTLLDLKVDIVRRNMPLPFCEPTIKKSSKEISVDELLKEAQESIALELELERKFDELFGNSDQD